MCMVYICRCLPFTLVIFHSDILDSRWQYNISIYHSVEYELNCYTCIWFQYMYLVHVPSKLFLHVHELEWQVIKRVLSFRLFLSVHLTNLKMVQDSSECISWNVEGRRDWPKATPQHPHPETISYASALDCMYNTCTCVCAFFALFSLLL